MAANVRAKVLIKGSVHGVLFRTFLKEKALTYLLKGWTRNIPEGVEAVFEGDRKDIEKVIKLCEKGPLDAKVYSVDVEWQKYLAEFKEFKIKE